MNNPPDVETDGLKPWQKNLGLYIIFLSMIMVGSFFIVNELSELKQLVDSEKPYVLITSVHWFKISAILFTAIPFFYLMFRFFPMVPRSIFVIAFCIPGGLFLGTNNGQFSEFVLKALSSHERYKVCFEIMESYSTRTYQHYVLYDSKHSCVPETFSNLKLAGIKKKIKGLNK